MKNLRIFYIILFMILLFFHCQGNEEGIIGEGFIMKKEDLKKIADDIADGLTAKKTPLPGCGSSSSFDCPTSDFACTTFE